MKGDDDFDSRWIGTFPEEDPNWRGPFPKGTAHHQATGDRTKGRGVGSQGRAPRPPASVPKLLTRKAMIRRLVLVAILMMAAEITVVALPLDAWQVIVGTLMILLAWFWFLYRSAVLYYRD